jgi:hypothetical protein
MSTTQRLERGAVSCTKASVSQPPENPKYRRWEPADASEVSPSPRRSEIAGRVSDQDPRPAGARSRHELPRALVMVCAAGRDAGEVCAIDAALASNAVVGGAASLPRIGVRGGGPEGEAGEQREVFVSMPQSSGMECVKQ